MDVPAQRFFSLSGASFLPTDWRFSRGQYHHGYLCTPHDGHQYTKNQQTLSFCMSVVHGHSKRAVSTMFMPYPYAKYTNAHKSIYNCSCALHTFSMTMTGCETWLLWTWAISKYLVLCPKQTAIGGTEIHHLDHRGRTICVGLWLWMGNIPKGSCQNDKICLGLQTYPTHNRHWRSWSEICTTHMFEARNQASRIRPSQNLLRNIKLRKPEVSH